MASVGNLVVNLMGNVAPLQKSLADAQGLLGSFQSRVAGIVATAATAIGAGTSVQAARSQIAEEKKLGAVLKATGNTAGVTVKEISDYAGELQDLTGIADDTTVAVTAMLASFSSIRGEQLKEALKVSQDLAVVMGTDMKSAAQTLSKALDDPTEGFGRLKRAGVFLTEGQKASITSLQASGNLSGARSAMLGSVGKNVSGAAEAVADPLSKFKATLGDLAETIGFVFLPVIGGLATGLKEVIKPLTDNREGFEKLGVEIGRGLKPIVGVLVGVVGVLAEIAQFFTDIPVGAKIATAAVFGFVAALVALKVATEAASKAKAISQSLSGPKGWATLAIGAAVATGAVALLDHASKRAEASTVRAAAASAKAAQAAMKQAEAQEKIAAAAAKEANRLKEVADLRKRVADATTNGSDRLSNMLKLSKEIDDIRTKATKLGDKETIGNLPRIEKDLVGQRSGLTDAIANARTELGLLNGSLTETDKIIRDIENRGGMFDEAGVAELRKTLKLLDGQRESNKLTEKAKEQEDADRQRADSIRESLQTPLEALSKQIDEINHLESLGNLDAFTAGQARDKAFGDFGGEVGVPQGNAALEQGSAAAFSAIQAVIRGDDAKKLQKEQRDIAKAQLDEMKKFNADRERNSVPPIGIAKIL